ncbi:MAG: hypothetical protein ACRDJN_28705, partial [Chloroflexota bacterium]
AGQRRLRRFDTVGPLRTLAARNAPAQEVADTLLAGALALDDVRAGDDMSVAVLAIRGLTATDGARRLVVYFPLR